jgi:hypothetical protein
MRVAGVCVLLAFLVAFAACSAKPAQPFANGSDAGVVAVQDAAAPPPIATPEAGSLGKADGPSSCEIHCSSDLHSVLDCANHLIATCPSAQGCIPGGGCAPACKAAEANKSTIGCEYFSIDPDVIMEGAGDCFAAYIANTWTTPITVTVDRAGQSLDPATFARVPSGNGASISYAPLPNGQIPPGQVAILFLAQSNNGMTSNDLSCPAGITPAYTVGDAAIHGTGMGNAFHITTSAPVVAYDIFPYGGGQKAVTSATLLLPASAWDTNYIAVNAFPQSQIAAQAGANPTLDIIAAEDGTTVTLSPTAPIMGANGVMGTSLGVPVTYSLSKGQVLQIAQPTELTGSPIQSNKPIGVWGGASCLNIDPNTCCCDEAHQQLFPVKALGSEYVGVRFRNRDDTKDESPPWRFVGAVDGTQLTYEPAPPPGAPPSLGAGQVLQFKASAPFVVKSQDSSHPFYVSAHMEGCETYFAPSDCRGDPEFVNVVPAAEYLASYVFFTDPTYPETNLVVVRNLAGDGSFKDVTLDCAGVLTGWQPVGTSGKYEYTRVDLIRHNFNRQGNCDNGRREMHSDAPFGVTVWGWGSAETGGVYGLPQAPGFYSQAVSYAYPAGMSVVPINTVVVPPVPK